MTKDKAVVEEVFRPSKNKSTPVLLKFQNGSLSSTHKDNTLYFPVQCTEDKTDRAVVIASGCVYSGETEQTLNNILTDSYICVRNKLTNKVRVIPIDQVKLINHVYQEKEKTKFTALSKDVSLALQMRNFGGRKEHRLLNSQQRNKVSVDVIKDQLDTTVEESSVLETADPVVSAEQNIERIRPPFNKEATSLDNVFKLYDVISLELIDRLDEEANYLAATEVDDIPIASEYLKSFIKIAKSGPQSTQNLLKLKIIIYMDALQTLIKSKVRILKKLELSKITEKVENDIREKFSNPDNDRQMRSSYTNEKALCYYLVLNFLITDNFELDMNILTTELCTPKTKILRFGHLINATLKSRTTTLALRLPSAIKPLGFAFTGKRKK